MRSETKPDLGRGDKDENGEPQYYLWETVTEQNKDALEIVHFPSLNITFDKLFAEVDMEY